MSGRSDQLRIQILGPVCAYSADRRLPLGPARQRALLALLAVRSARPVAKEEIIDAVWGEHPPASAVNGVHTYVKGLRQILEPDHSRRYSDGILASVAGGYELRLDPDQLDANVFEQRFNEASKHRAQGGLAAAARSLDRALELWQALPLLGIPGPWAQTERIRLTELRLAAVEERCEVLLACGQYADCAPELASLVREYPLRERFRAQLMTALYRTGRQADALAVFTQTRRILRTELGVEPGPELQQLQQQILRADPGIRLPAIRPANGTAAHHDLQAGGPRPSRPAQAGSEPHQLPAAGQGFVGRQAELSELTDLLDPAGASANTIVISAIGGMPGVGKTALALHWAHRVADQFPDGQLYVNLRGFDVDSVPVTPSQALRWFLGAFAVPAQQIPASVDAQAALFRSVISGQRILIVIDNARDEQQVRPLLPGGSGCIVVVTSRNLLAGLVAGENARPLPLDVLSEPESLQLLAGRLSQARLAAEPAAAAELVRLCSHLPLALSVAAARLATRPGLAIGAVVAELAAATRPLDGFTMPDPATSVRTVFSWSYLSLAGPAAAMFRLLGVHPGPEISASAAVSLTALSAAQVAATLAELTQLHLISEPASGRFTLHDLIRAYAVELAGANDQGTRDAAVHRLLDHYAHTARDASLLLNPGRIPIELPAPAAGVRPERVATGDQALAWFRDEHRTLLRVLELAAADGRHAAGWQIAWSIADFLGRQGYWHDWVATQRIALASAEQLGDEAGQAYAHRSLGEIFIQLGLAREAQPHLEEAIERYVKLGDLIGQAAACLAHAHLFEQQERFAESLTRSRQALGMYQAAGHRAGLARALNNVGWGEALGGDYLNALDHCGQALTLHDELGNRFGAAATLDSLGYAHHKLGDFGAAISCYQRAFELYGQLGERYQAADVLAHLGDVRQDAGERQAAREAWSAALATLDDLGHPAASSVREKLSRG